MVVFVNKTGGGRGTNQYAVKGRAKTPPAPSSTAQRDTLRAQAEAVAVSDPVLRDPLPEVTLQTASHTMVHWLIRDGYDPFDLNAPYQRGSVWTDAQRVNLIRSLYTGLPVGSIVTSEQPPKSKYAWRVVDGKQRIETVRRFVEDDFAVPGWWFRPGDLRYDDDAHDQVVWSDLSDRCHRHFEMTASMPSLIYNGQSRYVRRPGDARATGVKVDDDELLRSEAALYALINSTGTPQTREDAARARAVAQRPSPEV